jgi:7-cyano-7-deazaguanine synthase in queuosine biosynthesis
MAIITLRVSAGIQGTRAAFQWLRHFKNIFCSRLHYGNKTFEMTAVEFLYERLERMIPRTALYNMDKQDYFKQAKELEKQQIENAWKLGDTNGRIGILKTKEQYYNETYKKPLI